MRKPNYYVFPAILSYAKDGISVSFPDLPGCLTCGDTEQEALEMAKDALGGFLWVMEDYKDPIPTPSSLKDLRLSENEESTLVKVYMPAVRQAKNNKAVNRTVSLPAWLNAAAAERGINFSQVLQDALKKQIARG